MHVGLQTGNAYRLAQDPDMAPNAQTVLVDLLGLSEHLAITSIAARPTGNDMSEVSSTRAQISLEAREFRRQQQDARALGAQIDTVTASWEENPMSLTSLLRKQMRGHVILVDALDWSVVVVSSSGQREVIRELTPAPTTTAAPQEPGGIGGAGRLRLLPALVVAILVPLVHL